MHILDRLRLPHPFLLLLGGVAVAALLTWVLPARQFDRQIDPETQTSLVVAGTYQAVEPSPIGLLDALIAVPRGFVEGADIIFLILIVGGTFVLLDQTGALSRLVGALVQEQGAVGRRRRRAAGGEGRRPAAVGGAAGGAVGEGDLAPHRRRGRRPRGHGLGEQASPARLRRGALGVGEGRGRGGGATAWPAAAETPRRIKS